MTEKHRENPDKRQELGKKENVAWYSMAERCSLRKRNLKIMPYTVLLQQIQTRTQQQYICLSHMTFFSLKIIIRIESSIISTRIQELFSRIYFYIEISVCYIQPLLQSYNTQAEAIFFKTTYFQLIAKNMLMKLLDYTVEMLLCHSERITTSSKLNNKYPLGGASVVGKMLILVLFNSSLYKYFLSCFKYVKSVRDTYRHLASYLASCPSRFAYIINP